MRLPALGMLVALVLGAGCNDSLVSRSVGARCDRTIECDDRCLAPSEEWPGGFCTIDCDSDNDCPEDTMCIKEGDGGVCAYFCRDDRDCIFLGGYLCKERDAQPETAGKVNVCRGG